MDLAPTDEQEMLRAVVRRHLADRYPPARIAALADGPDGGDPAGWAAAAALGWQDPALGLVERAILAEESGYALHPVPWWGSLALPTSADVAAGSPVAVAPTGRPTPVAHRVDGGWRLRGEVAGVPDATAVGAVVVAAATGDGDALFGVDPRGDGCRLHPDEGVDPLRRTARLVCADAPARLLSEPGDGAPPTVRRRTAVLLAVEAVGVARRAYDLAVTHVGVRTQFGRPVGAYQGVAFAVADSYVRIELARSLGYRAAWLVEAADRADAAGAEAGPGGPTEVSVDAAVAAAVVAARAAAVGGCEQAIQAHGGMGMTWENPLHLWYRRALWFEAFDVATDAHLETVAAAVLDG